MSEKAKVRFYFFIVASLSIALVISLVIGICFFTSLHKKEKVTSVSRYKLSIGLVDTAMKTSTVPAKNAVRNGVLCTSLSQIAESCGYTKMINGNEIRFYLNNNDGDVMILNVGSDVATLNANPVHLSTPVYKVGEEVYVPLNTIITYFDGINVTVDDEKATIIIEYIEPKKCSLKLKDPKACEALETDDVWRE